MQVPQPQPALPAASQLRTSKKGASLDQQPGKPPLAAGLFLPVREELVNNNRHLSGYCFRLGKI